MRATVLDLMKQGYIPDWLARTSIRRRLARHPYVEHGSNPQTHDAESARLLVAMRDSPSAPHTAGTHPRHHELPIDFFQRVLGPRLKYSACWWPAEVKDLETAEAAMLALSCERAELGFDQDILELGCGWGALTLWLAEFYPNSRIMAVTDTHLQQEFIKARCQERGFDNVQVVTAKLNEFHPNHYFDRVLSVESFEYPQHDWAWMASIHRWLKPGGKLFMQQLSHQYPTNPCKTMDADGGMASPQDLLRCFQDTVQLEATWHFNGYHYQHTVEAWLTNLDRERDEIMRLFLERGDIHQAKRRFQHWRMFFIARAELFGYHSGEAWSVSHCRLK